MKFGRLNIKKYIIEIVQIIIGTAIIALGTSFFLLPNKLSSGGFSAIATITYYLFSFNMGTVILILNIPLFIIAYFKIGKIFLFKTLFSTILLSVFIDIFNKFPAFTNDMFLGCVYGGVIIGFGTAILYKANASTGGTELITHIIKEYNQKIGLSNLLVILDILIVLLNMFFLKAIEIGLYSTIAIYIMGIIIDIFFEGIYFTKLIFIISDKSEEISKEIGERIKRGTTGIYGKGMFKENEKLILMCAAGRRDIAYIKEISRKIDEGSFIIIANSREVFGKGFKK